MLSETFSCVIAPSDKCHFRVNPNGSLSVVLINKDLERASSAHLGAEQTARVREWFQNHVWPVEQPAPTSKPLTWTELRALPDVSFNEGDVVRCLHNGDGYNILLTVGREYTVLGGGSPLYPCFQSDTGRVIHAVAQRFELVTRAYKHAFTDAEFDEAMKANGLFDTYTNLAVMASNAATGYITRARGCTRS